MGLLAVSLSPVWWTAPFACAAAGLGFYMLHNTLQTNATQMTPEARATAVGIFSAALYFGQTLGVAINAPVFDRFSAVPVFLISGASLLALGLWLAHVLRQRRAAGL
jgi:predicted MFS family arabinose efflux permease